METRMGGKGTTATRDSRRSGSLTRRVVAVSVLLSTVIGGVFAVLVLAIGALRESESRATHALEVRDAANRLERLVIDIQTAERGFVITGDPRFLALWYQAQAKFRQQAPAMGRLASAGDAGQGGRAHQIALAGESYITDYSVPLVAMARRDPASARTVAVTEEGQRRIDALRDEFRQFMLRENQIYAEGRSRADASARRALTVAYIGGPGSIVFILFSGGYLAHSVIRPVRRASAMAGRVAAGDLTVRMPETGPGEVGALERSFNSMADSLQTSHGQLAASRARIVAAADETRRRIERDLHDGTQQRLIALLLELRAANASLPPEQPGLAEQCSRITQGMAEVIEELREISQGLHPAILEKGGLGPALGALVRRAGLPVELSVQVRARLPQHVEAAAYYVVSEALTNVAKHARASAVTVDAAMTGEALRLLIKDDGIGGADPSRGSGLIGLSDRVESVGGTIEVTSPPGGGTSLLVTIPVQQAAGQAGQ
jgi:signal transduction histidine kinase